MHVRTWWLILVGLLLLSGCTWQRIEAPPAYAADSFPLTIALMPSDDPASKEMANLLSSEFKTIGEFDGVIYPYRSGDEVDCILNLNAVGSAEGKGAGAGVVTGLTFGLAGTVVGPQTTIIHDIDFYLSNGAEQTDHYKIHIESEAEFGVFANIQEVAQKQTALQLRRIAIAMSEKLNMDRSSVMHTCTGYICND
jgi:hypothetical protein